MEPPKLEFAFEIRVNVTAGRVQELGKTAKGIRKIVPILGGTFEGPGINDTVLPGGYDWQLIRSDNVAEIAARYVLKTDDNAIITIVNTGIRHGSQQAMQLMAMGENVEPSAYYEPPALKGDVTWGSPRPRRGTLRGAAPKGRRYVGLNMVGMFFCLTTLGDNRISLR